MWEYVNIYLQICVLAAALGDVIGVAQIFFVNKKVATAFGFIISIITFVY